MQIVKWFVDGLKKPFMIPSCPHCGSKNISLTRGQDNATRASKKLLGGLLFLPLVLFVGKKPQGPAECFNCGKKWKI